MAEIKDPVTFREMSRPFESGAAADEAIKAFMSDLREIRKKHKIPNVYVVIQGSYKAEDGPDVEPEFIVSALAGGNLLIAEAMTAHAYGYEKAKREEYIGKVMAESAKPRRRKD